MKYEEFKDVVKLARKNSRTFDFYATWQTVRVQDATKCFDLNPFCVDLKSMTYNSTEKNLVSGRRMDVNLKECLEHMESWR